MRKVRVAAGEVAGVGAGDFDACFFVFDYGFAHAGSGGLL